MVPNSMPAITIISGRGDPIFKENTPGLATIPWVSARHIRIHARVPACGHGGHFGVMADEVERIVPEAVSVHPNGYRQVDYASLVFFPPVVEN